MPRGARVSAVRRHRIGRFHPSGQPAPEALVRDLAVPDPAASWCAPLRARDPEASALLGAWPTPRAIAEEMASELLDGLAPCARILDPACGGGMLLRAVAERLWEAHGARTPSDRRAVLLARVRGWDVDPVAVQAARDTLTRCAGLAPDALDEVVHCRDALGEVGPERFDAVVMNPPWVDAARMARAPDGHQRRAAAAARFTSARGAWDLCVPFVERAVTLVGDHGRVVALLPDKVLGSPWSDALRTWLAAHARTRVVARHDDRALGVGARAVVLRLDAGTATGEDGRTAPPRVLGDLAQVHGAATVAEAYAWAPQLHEGMPAPGLLGVVNTGTLAPWRTLWGERPMRYLGRRLLRPVLPDGALDARRAEVAASPKLLLPGLARTLFVVPDHLGRWLPGKSTVVVRPHAPEDLDWLAGWLGSRPGASAWQGVSDHLGLRGGWRRVGVKELAGLPVPTFSPEDRDRVAALTRAVVADPSPDAVAALDAAVDAALDRAR